jgi:hypothetical protein
MMDSLVGYYNNKLVFVRSAFLASHIKYLVKNGGPGTEKLIEFIDGNKALQEHLETVLAINPGTISNQESLAQAAIDFDHHQSHPLDESWSPYQLESIFQAYSGYGQEEMQKFLLTLADERSGGLGYRLRTMPMRYSLKRWDIDHQRKIIYLPEWYIGTFFVPSDDFGGKILKVTHKIAAELIKTAIHEEFMDDESGRSLLYRKLGAGAMMVGAVAGSIEASPFLILFVFAPQFIGGATSLADVNGGKGINPMRDLFGKLGSGLAGEDGKQFAETGYEVASLILCFRGGMKIVRAPKTESELIKTIQQAEKELNGGAKLPLALKPTEAEYEAYAKAQKMTVGQKSHIEMFEDGMSSFLTRKKYIDYVRGADKYGRADGLFVTTTKEANILEQEAGRNAKIWAKKLGLELEDLEGQHLLRIDMNFDLTSRPRLPSGLESGANRYYKYGGATKGGAWEMVVDPIAKSKWRRLKRIGKLK